MNDQQRLTLTVPDACQQHWQAMTAQPDGRFCESCQKTVVDFTAMTDPQLAAYFLNQSENVCGRFKANQLDRTIIAASIVPRQPAKQRWLALVALGLISWSTVRGQPISVRGEKIATSQATNPAKPTITGDAEVPYSLDSMVVVSGRVIDVTDRESLSGVNVTVVGTELGASTDKDGVFKLRLPAHQPGKVVLRFSYIGFTTQEKEVNTDRNLPVLVRLATDINLLDEVVYVGKVVPSVGAPTIPIRKELRELFFPKK